MCSPPCCVFCCDRAMLASHKQCAWISCVAVPVLRVLAAVIGLGITLGMPGNPARCLSCVTGVLVVHTTNRSIFIPHIISKTGDSSDNGWLAHSMCHHHSRLFTHLIFILFFSTMLRGGCCYHPYEQRRREGR